MKHLGTETELKDIVTQEESFDKAFAYVESIPVSVNTNAVFENKLNLPYTAARAGTYRVILSYGFNSDDTTDDFEGRLLVDGAQFRQTHKEEPKDTGGTFSGTGTNQRKYINRQYYFTLTEGQSITFDFEFRTALSGAEASTWEAYLSVERVI